MTMQQQVNDLVEAIAQRVSAELGTGTTQDSGCDVAESCDTCRGCHVKRPDDVRKFGVIDLPTIQKWMNFHYSMMWILTFLNFQIRFGPAMTLR